MVKHKRKTRKRISKRCKCKCRCKNCPTKKYKKDCCKICVKKRCCCVLNLQRKRKSNKRRRVKRRTRRRYRGGNKQSNMGEVFTGYKRNMYNLNGSLYPKSTQSDIPKQGGGGLLSQRAIDFGLGNALTFARDGMNTFKNVGRTWYGDRHVDSADPVVAGERFNKE